MHHSFSVPLHPTLGDDPLYLSSVDSMDDSCSFNSFSSCESSRSSCGGSATSNNNSNNNNVNNNNNEENIYVSDSNNNRNNNPQVDLMTQTWFHGKISRVLAEKCLKCDGDFLVRESSASQCQYVLSGMKDGTFRHILLINPDGKVGKCCMSPL